MNNDIQEQIKEIIVKSIDTPKRSKRDAEFIFRTIRPELISNLLNFISSLQSQTRETTLREVEEKVIGMKKYHPDFGKHIHTYVFENKGNCGICGMSWKNSDKEFIYNKALDDLLKALKQEETQP